MVLGSVLETYRHHRLGMDGFRLYHLLLVSWLVERLLVNGAILMTIVLARSPADVAPTAATMNYA